MRFGLLDVLFAIACFTIGMLIGGSLFPHPPRSSPHVSGLLFGLGVYLALLYPVYRGLKLFPMILPRCPHCGGSEHGFHVLADRWPRVSFRCPRCHREFTVWHNGKPGDEETWEIPVLVLKWPYAFGIYKRAKKPEPDTTPNASPADAPPAASG